MIVAAYQGPSPAGDANYAFQTIDKTLAEAAALGAKMTVFPAAHSRSTSDFSVP